MLLLLFHDGPNCLRRLGIPALENQELLLQVPENDTLDGDGRRCDGPSAEKSGHHPQCISSGTTKKIAAATTHSSPLQFGPEYVPMRLFVRPELPKLGDQRSGGEWCEKKLPCVDMDGTILARVVHLEDASPQSVGGEDSRAQFHEDRRKNDPAVIGGRPSEYG